MTQPIIRNSTPVDKKLYKKCIKCRLWKPRADILDTTSGEVLEKKAFGAHNSSDGLQSICGTCKNLANTKSRKRNVSSRIRHHTATRCLTQLGDHAPEGFTADMENYLGYKITALVKALGEDLKEREGPSRKLRDALNEGYHIDHKRPLSSFKVIQEEPDPLPGTVDPIYVDWAEFKACWDITNLTAIPAEENLAKGAKRLDLLEDTPHLPIPDAESDGPN